ncbi:hypothetical protein CTKA_02480 [Chthonomonas calidirosea]|uniref:Uncharacterized protein n=1 Tax=Chthonomonas calidirosea (strain DSM 23976 / ICMP 18418 / T49) TaxID=1303518 RepID=S0EVI3_CHTCT|nr:hypothetical protein [Chthonomonas calidirosea]CCW35436.1 hypothetical protein CCALI_01620 [Chthonomonas calidirosea T49]CEK20283.1 hypothetical protein CTKA_02480 [Chthonomonas calidirosea]
MAFSPSQNKMCLLLSRRLLIGSSQTIKNSLIKSLLTLEANHVIIFVGYSHGTRLQQKRKRRYLYATGLSWVVDPILLCLCELVILGSHAFAQTVKTSGLPIPPTGVGLGQTYSITVRATAPTGLTVMSVTIKSVQQDESTGNWHLGGAYTFNGSGLGPTIIHTFSVANYSCVEVYWSGEAQWSNGTVTAWVPPLQPYGSGYGPYITYDPSCGNVP